MDPLVRLLSLTFGVTFLYCAFFLYENEEGTLQNALEDSWIRLHDLSRKAVGRAAAFMKVVAQLSTDALNYIFGDHLFSWPAIAVSTCYSLASFIVGWIAFLRLFGDHASYVSWWAGWPAVLLIAVGSLRHFTRKMSIAWSAGVLASGLIGFTWILALTWGAYYLLLLLVFSYACDVCFITITRAMLRSATNVDSFGKSVTMLLVNLALAALLCVLPIAIVTRQPDPGNVPNYVLIALQGYSMTGFYNLLDAVVASLFLMLALLMLLHRLFWPLIERPLYAMARHRLLQNRKMLFTAGFLMIAFAIPQLKTWLDLAKQLR